MSGVEGDGDANAASSSCVSLRSGHGSGAALGAHCCFVGEYFLLCFEIGGSSPAGFGGLSVGAACAWVCGWLAHVPRGL